jgi:hypothetical protein
LDQHRIKKNAEALYLQIMLRSIATIKIAAIKAKQRRYNGSPVRYFVSEAVVVSLISNVVSLAGSPSSTLASFAFSFSTFVFLARTVSVKAL